MKNPEARAQAGIEFRCEGYMLSGCVVDAVHLPDIVLRIYGPGMGSMKHRTALKTEKF